MKFCINSLDNMHLTKKGKSLKIKEFIKQKKYDNGYFKSDSKLDQYQVKDEDKILHIKKKNKRFKHSFPLLKSNTIKFEIANILFIKWFNKNLYRFNTKPIITKQIKDGLNLEFEGVIKNISIFIKSIPEVTIIFEYDDECIDMYDIAYIGQEMHNPKKGYYDSDRVDGIYTNFKTREELYINEVFEPLLQYCNQHLTDKHSLYMCISQGYSCAFIDTTNDCERKNLKNVDTSNSITSTTDGENLYLENKASKNIKINLFDLNKEIDISYDKK